MHHDGLSDSNETGAQILFVNGKNSTRLTDSRARAKINIPKPLGLGLLILRACTGNAYAATDLGALRHLHTKCTEVAVVSHT